MSSSPARSLCLFIGVLHIVWAAKKKNGRKRGGGHGEKESKPGKKAKNKIDRSWIEKKVAHSEQVCVCVSVFVFVCVWRVF